MKQIRRIKKSSFAITTAPRDHIHQFLLEQVHAIERKTIQMLNKSPPSSSLHFEKLTERHARRLIQLMEVTDSHRQTILNFEMAIIMRNKKQDQGEKWTTAAAAQQQLAKRRNTSTRRPPQEEKLDESGKRRELLLRHCTTGNIVETNRSTPLSLPRTIKKIRKINQQQVPPPSVSCSSACLSPRSAPLALRSIENDKSHEDLPRNEALSPVYYSNTTNSTTNRSPHLVLSVPPANKIDALGSSPSSPKDQRGGSIPQYISFASKNTNVASTAAPLCRQQSSSSRGLSDTLSLSSLDDIDCCDIPSPITGSWNDDSDIVTEFLCGKTRIMLDDSGNEKNAHKKEHQHTARTPHKSPLRRRLQDNITRTKQEEQAHEQEVETVTNISTRGTKRRRRNSTPSLVSIHEAAPAAQRRRSAEAFHKFLFPESNCTPPCSHDAAILVHPRRRSTKTFQNFFFPESSC